MTDTNELQPGARDYLDAVAAHLSDLDVATRGELIADVADALAEQPTDSSFEQLVVKLGAPRAFADELRAAAGTAPRVATDASPQASTPGAASRFVDGTSAALAWSGRELEPLWWIVRGLTVAAVVYLLVRVIGFGFMYNEYEVAAAFALIAVVISLALGIRGRARGTDTVPDGKALRLRGAATVGLGLLFLLVVTNLVGTRYSSGPVDSYGVAYEESLTGLQLNGAPVNNIYAFDEQGKPLNKVRLFTESGMPLDLFAEALDPSREVFADRVAERVFNVFPVRYRDPATGEVTDPGAGFPKSPGPLRGSTVAEPLTSEAAVAAEPSITDPAGTTQAAPAKPAVVTPAKPAG